MNESMIDARNLTKIYVSGEGKVPALCGFDLTVKRGESVSLMGPSGSGKSTALSVIGALNPPDGGSIIIDGIDVYTLPPEKRADFRREYIGFVFQQFQLIPYLTALENVILPLTVTGCSRAEKHKLAGKVLARVGLEGKGSRLPGQLSGGEQERVAIARAVVNNPPVILADEPTGNLDTRTGKEIMGLFRSLNNEGRTVIMVTHNRENAARMGRVVLMQDGMVTNGNYKESMA